MPTLNKPGGIEIIFAATWIALEDVLLGNVFQKEHKHQMFSIIWTREYRIFSLYIE